MAVANMTTHANALEVTFRDKFIHDLLYRNPTMDFFRAILGEPKPHTLNDKYYSWGVKTAGNTSVELFTESTSYPTAVAQTNVVASVLPIYARAAVTITRSSLDAVADGGSRYSIYEDEMAGGMKDVQDLMAVSFLTDSTRGLVAMISHSGGADYATLDRSAIALWQSAAVNVNGALEMADLEDGMEIQEDNDKGGILTHWIMPRNQWTNITRLQPSSGVKNYGLDPLIDTVNKQLAARPVFTVGDLTDTLIFGVDFSSPQTDWAFEEFRGFDVYAQAPGGDNLSFQISSGYAIACKKPHKSLVLYGVTA